MIKAQVVAHSVDPRGNELVSILATFPRIILAEVNTHRMLSKNTSSSRAIPFNKMVESVLTNPFIPIAWQKEHKGMQGSEYITDEQYISDIENSWLLARDKAVEEATYLHNKGVTKQLCNRLLEPFMWTTMLITGPRHHGGWDNFFKLRCPYYEVSISPDEYVTSMSWKELMSNPYTGDFDTYNIVTRLSYNKGQAEIHMMTLAESIYDAINESTPNQLKPGEWHIPFGEEIHLVELKVRQVKSIIPAEVKISTAMAARTSYTIVGDEKEVDYNKMIGLHDRLIAQNPPHSSPMEHCAKVMTWDEYNENIKGRINTTSFYGDSPRIDISDSAKGWCRNFRGFIPYRQLLELNTK